MGECGCTGNPSQAFAIKTRAGEYVLVAIYEYSCLHANIPPVVQAGLVDEDEVEDWVENYQGFKVYDQTPMYVGAVAWLERTEGLSKALSHVLEPHVHDPEECPEFFTRKEEPRAEWRKLSDDE